MTVEIETIENNNLNKILVNRWINILQECNSQNHVNDAKVFEFLDMMDLDFLRDLNLITNIKELYIKLTMNLIQHGYNVTTDSELTNFCTKSSLLLPLFYDITNSIPYNINSISEIVQDLVDKLLSQEEFRNNPIKFRRPLFYSHGVYLGFSI